MPAAVILAAGCATAPSPPDPELRPPPPDAESLWGRAIGDWEQGDDESALQGIQKLLAHYPEHLEGQRALVEMLLGTHGEPEALSFLRERAAARPEHAGPRFALGYALGRTGDTALMQEGRAVLAPIARDQGAALVLEVLSDLVAALDAPVPAAALAEQAARARRRESEFDQEFANLMKAGRYLHLAGEWVKARQTLDKALRQAEVVHSGLGAVRAQQALGASAQSLGQLEEATTHFQAAVRAVNDLGHAGPRVTAMINLAELYELQGDQRSEADRIFSELASHAAEIPQLHAEVRLRRARVLVGRGEGDLALEELSAAVETLRKEQAWQQIAKALALAGRIHLEAGRWQEAVTELAQAAQVWAAAVEQGADPSGLARAKIELGEALLDGGQVADAAELLREARALAAEAGHGPLTRRAERGGIRCDLRMGTPDDIKLALDRARAVDDPWTTAEALVGLGDWVAAEAPARAALDPSRDPPTAELPVRYALLVAVMLNTGDAGAAWAAYRAGTVAQLEDRLRSAGISPVRPPGGLSPALTRRFASVRAQIQAADSLLDQPLTPSVDKVWRNRRKDLGVRRHRLVQELAAARPAWASLLMHQAQAAPDRPDQPGVAWISVLPGEREALGFIATTEGVVAERLPALTDQEAGREFWKRIRAASGDARTFVLSPPPELVHLAWHDLEGAPPAKNVRYRPSAVPLAKPPAGAPAAPLKLPADPLAVDLPTLLAGHLHGTTPEFDAPMDSTEVPALDAVIRAALYAGADAVKVRTPDGAVLSYTR